MGIKSSTALVRFSAGQIGAKLRKAFDLPFYLSGGEKFLNFIPYVQGPARFREGGRYADTVIGPAAIVPFVFTDDQAYVLVFTHRRMRVYKDDALIVDQVGVGPITGIVEENPGFGDYRRRITKAGHGLNAWDEIYIEGLTGAGGTLLNNPRTSGTPYIVREVIDANTFDIDGKFAPTFTASASSKIYRVASCSTPYRGYDDGSPNVFDPPDGLLTYDKPTMDSSYSQFEAPEFLTIQYAQANDVMYVVHPNVDPAKITRLSDTSWTCATYTRSGTDPFASSNNPTAVTFYEQRLIYGATGTAPQKINGSDSGAFQTHTVGTAATNSISYQAAARKLSAVRTLIGNADFLIVGTSDSVLRMQGSGQNDALSPTNVLLREISNQGVASVMPAMVGDSPTWTSKDLKRTYALQVNQSGAFTPIDLTKQSDEILNGLVRKIGYQRGDPGVLWHILWDGTLVGLNLDASENVLAWHPHATRPGDRFIDIAITPRADGTDKATFLVERDVDGETVTYLEVMEPPTVWPRRENYFTGTTAAAKLVDDAAFRLAMYEAQKRAIHMDCAATYDGSDRSGTITAAATTGTGVNFTASVSQFVAGDVGRQIWEKNGTGRAQITGYTSGTVVVCTILTAFASTSAIAAGSWYLTAGTITGLDHLEGEVVTVIVDGGIHPDCTVASGSITLQMQGSYVQVGLGYKGMIKTMNIESGGVNGPAQGKLKNIVKAVVSFLDSAGAKIGTSLYDLATIPLADSTQQNDMPAPLFSGEVALPVFDSSATEKHVYIVQERALPCTVAMITPFLDTAVS